ncbi:MAG TPA: DUF192 domain-containing protein [Candidatus Anoxymicrobiaceae bacterium]
MTCSPERIVNSSRQTIIASDVGVALSRRDRSRGLIGRDGMREKEALVIPRCRQVHTFGMRFAIDVLFVGRDGAVVRVCRDLSPRRISPVAWRGRIAIELPAGTAERTGTSAGDIVRILDRD